MFGSVWTKMYMLVGQTFHILPPVLEIENARKPDKYKLFQIVHGHNASARIIRHVVRVPMSVRVAKSAPGLVTIVIICRLIDAEAGYYVCIIFGTL